MKDEARLRANEINREIEGILKDMKIIEKNRMVVATHNGYVYSTASTQILGVIRTLVIDDLNKQLRNAELDMEEL